MSLETLILNLAKTSPAENDTANTIVCRIRSFPELNDDGCSANDCGDGNVK